MGYQIIGTRCAALLLDCFLIGSFYLLSGLVATNFSLDTEFGFDLQKFIFLLKLLFLLSFVVIFLYFIVMEALFGWTLGKLALGLEVVREDGSPCGLIPSLIRNIFRLVDWLPVCYVLGAFFMWTSPLKQRLGDRLAHTIVRTVD